MKKIFKYMIPCMAFALSLTSCNETMDDKAKIDAQYDTMEAPAIAMASAAATAYDKATVTGTVLDLENVQEVGFQVATDAQFSSFDSYVSDEVATTFTAEITDLQEKTTYYVRSYVFTKTGKIAVSEATSFTTPKAPIYDIDGTYTVTEYNASTGEAGASTYQMTVTFDESNPSKVYIYNLWDGDETMTGVYDAETNTISVPSNQNIYYYPGYGYVIARGVNDAITAYVNKITFTFTPLGGTMVSSIMQAYLTAASYSFGFFYVSMKHNDDVEPAR